MMSMYFLLLLMPIVYSQIAIKITTGRTARETSVEFSGRNIAIISDKERKSFNVEDDSLKEAIEKYSGRVPTYVYVKNPSWADVYNTFNWEQVQRTLIPIRSRVIGIHTKPIIVSTQDFVNPSHVPVKYTAAISQQVQQTVTNSWFMEKELTVGQDITYNVNYGAGSIEGTNSMSCALKWGRETIKAKTVTLGTTTGMEVELKPGQAVVATLTATHGTLDIEVDYEAYLTGQVFASFDPEFQGHNWWAYPVHDLLKAASLPNSVTSTEKISIGFFTSGTVEVRDKKISSKIIKIAPCRIIDR